MAEEQPAAPTSMNKPKVALRLPVLPKTVLRHVLQFLVDSDDVPDGPHSMPWDVREGLRSLSPDYAAVVDELVADYVRSALTIDIQSLDEAELQRVYSAVETAGTAARSLCIRVGTNSYWLELYPGLGDIPSLDRLVVDWARIFTACPNLQRLDLSYWPLQTRQLVQVLDAASQHCKHVDALVMPKYGKRSGPVDKFFQPTSDLRAVTEMVETALERWHTHGTRMRQLRLPQRMMNIDALNLDVVALNDRFLGSLTRFCPDLEYLDGYRETFDSDQRFFCDEFLCCSPDVWHKFCASCTKLRELNWFILPYFDPFFESFGEFPKPNLTKLVLAAGEHHEYPAEYDVYDGALRFSSTGIAKLFAGCPALKHLEIPFLTEDDETFEGRQDEWTDDVLLAIARHCELLESFEMTELDAGSLETMVPMTAITAVGVEALAQMPRLVRIHIKPTQCGAQGILSLMEHAPVVSTNIEPHNVRSSSETSRSITRYDRMVIHDRDNGSPSWSWILSSNTVAVSIVNIGCSSRDVRTNSVNRETTSLCSTACSSFEATFSTLKSKPRSTNVSPFATSMSSSSIHVSCGEPR